MIAAVPPDVPDWNLRRRWSRRRWFNTLMNGMAIGAAVAAAVPLVSLLWMVLVKGLAHFRLSMLWELPPGAGMAGGGFGNALLGTVLIVLIAAVISVPIGISAAVFLTEYPGRPRIASAVRFATKVLSGLPSILAGVFIFATVVSTTRTFSLLAGSLSLAVLMFPIVTIAAEEALHRVPRALREAAFALGATASQTVVGVVIPAARSSIATGVSLAIARAAGETAPLIFTALFSDYWVRHLFEPTASLAVLIYNFSGVPYENQLQLSWSASLVLVALVCLANIATQIAGRRR